MKKNKGVITKNRKTDSTSLSISAALQLNDTCPAKDESESDPSLPDNKLVLVKEENDNLSAKLITANRALLLQNKEKEKRADELIIANKELLFQNKEKEKRADELIIANRELLFQNKEKEKRANELIIANRELIFQNEEKEKRADELMLLNSYLNNAEYKIIKANRLYSVISQINKVITHVKDEQTLFKEVCKIVIEHGNFKMAWIGIADTHHRKVNLVASYGATSADLKILSNKTYDINGPTENILHGADSFVINNTQDNKVISWSEYAKRRGFYSAISLPIKKSGKVIGTFDIYSAELNFFDTEEIKMLKQVTADIAFGLKTFEKAKQLKESESKYSNLFYLSPQPMWVLDPETLRFIQVNKAATLLYEYSEAEFMHMRLPNIKIEESIIKENDDVINSIPANEFYNNTFSHLKKSGKLIEVEIYSTPMLINGKSFRLEIVIDVTEKNMHEHAIEKAVIQAQEDERYEIGGELHDNICQLLATSKMNLGMLKASLIPKNISNYNQCMEHISLALLEIRNISHRLAPVLFDNVTLDETFSILLDTFNVNDKYKILTYFDDTIKQHPINQELQLNLYRILQEQLRNILTYSHATLIEVSIIIKNNKLRMSISDNGDGFNAAAVQVGIGFANMKRRVKLFSGVFVLDSCPGNGCKIIIEIPLPELNETIDDKQLSLIFQASSKSTK